MSTAYGFDELARHATYIGSPEHKRIPNPLANPALHSDKSDCDAVDATISNNPLHILHVLRSALRRGQISGPKEGAYPRYVHGWMVLSGGERALFRGRLTNREQGVYKGYFEAIEDLPGSVHPKLIEGGEWWSPIA